MHYEPKSLVVAKRYRFHKCDQGASESVADYVAELAAKCGFGASLDEALCDRLVYGVRSKAIQRKLLTEGDLTITEAVEIAKSMEAVQSNAQAVKTAALVGEVHTRKLTHKQTHRSLSMDGPESKTRDSPPRSTDTRPCHRCGSTSHQGSTCMHQNSTCHSCGVVGHLARVCHQSRGQRGRRLSCGRGRGRAYWLESYGDAGLGPEGDEQIWEVLAEGLTLVNPYKVTMELNGVPVTMDIDTGATVSLILESTFQTLFPRLPLPETTVQLRTYIIQPLSVVGQVQVTVKYRGYTGLHRLIVVKGQGPFL